MAMLSNVLHCDFETYSDANISKTGGYHYARHPSTEAICMAWCVDDGPVQLWTAESGFPFPAHFFEGAGTVFVGHNCSFELEILEHCLGVKTDPSQWRDTAAMAAARNLPRHLDGACSTLGLEHQKSSTGKELIRKLCIPQRDGSRNRNPELLEQLYAYCVADVEAERDLYNALPPLNETEQAVWELDARINARGLPVDVETVRHAVALYDELYQQTFDRLKALTGLDNPNSQKQFLQWLQENGCNVADVSRGTLVSLLHGERK